MAPLSPASTKFMISTNISEVAASTFDWDDLAFMDSYSRDTSPSSSNQKFYFGSLSPITSTVGKVTTYSVSGGRDPSDTDGQEVFVASAEAEPPVDLVIAVIRDWQTPGSEYGYYQRITPGDWSESGEREGDAIEVSFSATAAGLRVKFSGGIPTAYP